MNRRNFARTMAMAAAGMALARPLSLTEAATPRSQVIGTISGVGAEGGVVETIGYVVKAIDHRLGTVTFDVAIDDPAFAVAAVDYSMGLVDEMHALYADDPGDLEARDRVQRQFLAEFATAERLSLWRGRTRYFATEREAYCSESGRIIEPDEHERAWLDAEREGSMLIGLPRREIVFRRED